MNRGELRDLDALHVWHPFTPHSAYADDDPLMVVAGEGHYLIDADGRRYLDGVSSLWCNLFGHRRAEIDQAIREQLDRIAPYVSADKKLTFCIYDAPDPDAIRRAARRNALPIDRITEVRVLEPYFYY